MAIWEIESNSSVPKPDSLINEADALTIETSDAELINHVEARIKQSKDWYVKEKNLPARQDRNFNLLMGRGEDDKSFKKYSSRYKDNAIWEGEASIKPIALSRLPDFMVNPGTDNPDSVQIAQQIGDIIDTDLKRRENRQVLGKSALKHHPVYFIGVIKCRWDKDKNGLGDYVFESVHPKNIVLDNTATDNDPTKMDFIAESLPISIKELLILFPNKKEEIYKELDLSDNDPEEGKKLSTKWNIYEVWFKWYEKGTNDAGETTYKPIECLLWKYKKILFKKIKNPYWDWKGQSKLFIDGQPAGTAVLQQLMQQSMMTGQVPQGVENKTVFKNYFEMPMKPYILIGYEQWGEMAYDETTRIEQVIPLQQDADKRGRQITEMSDRARGKHVFSTASGLKKEDIQNLDLNNPDVDLLVNGDDVRKVHDFIQGEQPSEALFRDKELQKTAIFNKMGVHDTTRGEMTPGKPGVSDQIAREADYGRIDDLAEEIINAPAEMMAKWAMHMIKMFYTEDHFKRILGPDGSSTFAKINSDMVEEGMEIIVSASGTDKVMKQRTAVQLAQMKMTDPLSFYQDLGFKDAKLRAEKLFMFTADPQGYFTKYILGLETPQQQANALSTEIPQPADSAISTEGAAVPVNPSPPVVQSQESGVQ